MKKLLLVFCTLSGFAFSQTIGQCKKRFDNYLNFNGSLNSAVSFEPDAIYILSGTGEKEFAIYQEEVKVLTDFFEHSSQKQQQDFVAWKGIRRLSSRQRDSLLIYIDDRKTLPKLAPTLPLKGFRIAIDPGHFATTLAEAKVEQKYLYFLKDSIRHPNDTIKLFESQLTFNTAQLLKNMLEEQGAKVFITRSQPDHTSFNCTYTEWVRDHRSRTLDSLKQGNLLPVEKYGRLVNCSPYKLFWDFFRDYDITNRANKINAFKPHLSVIIHYNVDEKNYPWKKCTDKNYTMAFIGGSYTASDLNKPESRANFLRMLLTEQLKQSQELADLSVKNFKKNLDIPAAKAGDADYLTDNCISTSSPGVFCRNLILCRKVTSPLVYGESLYQDNEKEASLLMRTDTDLYGVQTNTRLAGVAQSYYDAIFSFLKNY